MRELSWASADRRAGAPPPKGPRGAGRAPPHARPPPPAPPPGAPACPPPPPPPGARGRAPAGARAAAGPPLPAADPIRVGCQDEDDLPRRVPSGALTMRDDAFGADCTRPARVVEELDATRRAMRQFRRSLGLARLALA